MTGKAVAVLLFVVLFGTLVCASNTACLSTLSMDACERQGCQVVKGTRCSSSATAPPCDLSFNNQNNQDCCDPSNTSHDKIHYLGCMPKGYACMTQCMQYVETNEVYLIWEGCAFESHTWKDVSGDAKCQSCFADICPAEAQDNSWAKWMILFAILCVVLAVVLLIGAAGFGVLLFLRRFILIQKQKTARPYVPMTQMPTSKDLNEPTPRYNNQNGLKVFRTDDGLISITFPNGNTRVVTPEQYQVLYDQQTKRRRAIWAKLQSLKRGSTNARESEIPIDKDSVFEQFSVSS